MSVEPAYVDIAVRINAVRVGAQATHGRLYSTLDIPECGWTDEIGKPRLPVIRRLVKIPQGSQSALELDALEVQNTPLTDLTARHMLFPVQRPVEKLPGAFERTPFEMDEAFYARDEFYPAQTVTTKGPFHIRGHALLLVEFYPIQYNPARGEIRLTEHANLRLTMVGATADPRSPEQQPKFSPAFDRWMARNVLNYTAPRDPSALPEAGFAEGILVVAGDNFAQNAELADYLEARRDEGHKIQVATMSSIGTTDDDLRAYVREQYLSWSEPALSYVVLVGDVEDVPTHTGSGGGRSQATDLYYSSVDPADYAADLLAPDLMVSRISVNDETELATYLQRASAYTQAEFTQDVQWMNKLSFIASCDNSQITEGTHNYVIDTYTADIGFVGTYPQNPTPGGDKLWCSAGIDRSTIQEALGDGRLAINFSGHGGETSWADPSFVLADLQDVAPPDAAPFVISNACITGRYARSGGDCWGEIWMAHAHGAIIFLGASNNSYWGEDDIMEKRMWDGVFQDGITRFGPIAQNTRLQLLAHYGATGSMEYYFEMYNMLGDASLDFYTGTAFDMSANYQQQIQFGANTVDVSVSNQEGAVAGALVCIRGLGVQQVGLTDSSGAVQLTMDPPPEDVGNLTLTITAHNAKRHQGTIEVIPAAGPYLTHAGHELTSDGQTPVAPNPGAHIVMPITLENTGVEAATGIQTTLSADSALVSISQDQPEFDAISDGQTGRSSVHAEFDISADAQDGALVWFLLEWTTASGDSGSAQFSMSVVRPILSVQADRISDAEGGCDTDGIADVDEPSVFSLTIVNEGSGQASQVMVAMSAPDCTVSGPVAIGNLPPGGKAQVDFTVTPQTGMACPAEEVLFEVSATAAEMAEADIGAFTETLNADIAAGFFTDDMEGTEPNGWSHHAATGTDDWGYVTDSAHSPFHAWFASDVAGLKDAYLITPTIGIGDASQMTFWHRYDLESYYDGAVLEISTDGGQSFIDLGDYITQGGYTHTISTGYQSPIMGRGAWSSNQGWQQVVVDLSSFGPAEVSFRFRLACDTSVAGVGWWIDDVVVDSEIAICQQQQCRGGTGRLSVVDVGSD
jgi:hypothetical protein